MSTRITKTSVESRLQPPREISSEELLQGRSELVIRHNEQRYILRITANKKLILTR